MTSWIFLNSCAYNIKDATPEFIDSKAGYARIYKFVPTKNPKCGDPAYTAVYSGQNIPLSQMSGHIALPTEQAQEIFRIYNQYEKDKQKCK